MNITDSINAMTMNNAEKQVFVSRPTVEPPYEKWIPEPYLRTWLGKQRATHSTSGMAQQNLKKDNHYGPLWKFF